MSPAGEATFSISEELSATRLAIEASAGTGKTFTLAALAARAIAEDDVAAAQLLIVTFTRAATGELRARVRERLVGVAEGLARPVPPAGDDELLSYLWATDRPLRLERVRRALSEFDSATITTIHGFATQVLGSLGTTSGTDQDAALADDGDELLDAACADVLATAATTGSPAADLPTFHQLRQATKTAAGSGDMDLVPGSADLSAGPGDRLMTELVTRSLDTMTARRRGAGTLSYDDLLTEVRRAVFGAGRQAALQAVRARYKVALIDEFQDTDSVQWDIFQTLFGAAESGTDLVLVGDPKQAIYAFRGANVYTYLNAVSSSPETVRRSLTMNWRSDGAALTALGALLEGATFGDEQIAFVPSVVAPGHADQRLTGPLGDPLPSLSLRLALGPDLERTKQSIVVESAARAVNRDLVTQVRALLDGATIPGGGGEEGARRVLPADIAVLVRTGREALDVQTALNEQGVPAVLARGESVLNSAAAEQWRRLLWSIGRPSDPARARAVALSWFGGWTAAEIDGTSEERVAQLQELMQGWGETLTSHGVTAFVRQIWSESGVAARVLAQPDGDRAITDLQHVGELLQSAAPSVRSSVAGLLSVLATEPVIDADVEEPGDVTARRIESEADAVQIMTVWVAKGLEFPIVCLPSMWRSPKTAKVIYQDPVSGRRTFDVTGGRPWPDKAEAGARRDRAQDEYLGEQLRLLYVGLTRAKHHTIVWWSRTQSSEFTALAHLLFARSTDGRLDPERYRLTKVKLPPDDEAVAKLAPLLGRAGGTIVAAGHGDSVPPRDRWVGGGAAATTRPLDLAHLDQLPDRDRHRWSFTAMTRQAETAAVDPYDPSLADRGAGDEAELADDVVEVEVEEGRRGGAPSAAPSPSAAHPTPAMSLLPAGAAFGTLVHSVLEGVDFSGADLKANLTEHVDRQLLRTGVDLTPTGDPGRSGRDLLVDALDSVIASPLAPGLALRDLGQGERINEMAFELRLADAGRRATVRDIGHLLVAHLPPADPFVGWARSLAAGAFDVTLAGHLTGSIDLIFRRAEGAAAPRYVVADYKTNRLGQRGQAPEPGAYGRDPMVRAMVEHHYPLQALLYMVALHRYLRWRLPDYEAATHLGGALYLFVRGMTGPDVAVTAGHPDGVLEWAIPPSLVEATSDLLHGRQPTGSP
ncbi:MAG TPA: UvrD-helicase domain-containing protein [Acidimicrobiales bacterium]|nr:UvrD-helicase domain-containing protein [Acidimicrobiales bacterium]